MWCPNKKWRGGGSCGADDNRNKKDGQGTDKDRRTVLWQGVVRVNMCVSQTRCGGTVGQMT